MRIFAVMAVLCLALVAGVGCAEEGESGGGSGLGAESDNFDRELEREERELERELEDEEREFEEELEPEPEPEVEEEAPEELEEPEESECDPNYAGACLDPYASDYDCEGGSGDGPSYTGPVTVVGEDHYGLDADGDGSACE